MHCTVKILHLHSVDWSRPVYCESCWPPLNVTSPFCGDTVGATCQLAAKLYTVYTIHCEFHSVKLYTVHCTVYSVQCTIYNLQCTQYYTVHYTLPCLWNTVNSKVYTYTVHTVHRTLYTAQCRQNIEH